MARGGHSAIQRLQVKGPGDLLLLWSSLASPCRGKGKEEHSTDGHLVRAGRPSARRVPSECATAPLPLKHEQWGRGGRGVTARASESPLTSLCSATHRVSHPARGYFGTGAVFLTTAGKIKYDRGDKRYRGFI